MNGVFERKANTFTGSVKTISSEELKRVGNSNVLSSLKNLDPSILFIDNMALGSDPNAVPEIVLRGKSSINMEGTDLKANDMRVIRTLLFSCWTVLKFPFKK